MANEPAGSLPDELRDWLDERTAERGVEREELLARAVAAYRLLERADEDAPDGIPPRDDLAELADRVDAVESAFDEKLADVRRRIVQVKHETDGKAPADHDHEDLAAEVGEALDAVGEIEREVAALERRTERGFDNYEEVVTYLRDATDDLDAQLRRLATAAVDLRSDVASLATAEARRDAVAALRREANRAGVTSAKCEACGESVSIGLLSAPACPHCDRTFESVRPGRGFFGSAVLVAGSHPRLEGETGTADPGADASAADLLEDDDD